VRNAQKLFSSHSQVDNLFNLRRDLISRSALRKFRAQARIDRNIVMASYCV